MQVFENTEVYMARQTVTELELILQPINNKRNKSIINLSDSYHKIYLFLTSTFKFQHFPIFYVQNM